MMTEDAERKSARRGEAPRLAPSGARRRRRDDRTTSRDRADAIRKALTDMLAWVDEHVQPPKSRDRTSVGGGQAQMPTGAEIDAVEDSARRCATVTREIGDADRRQSASEPAASATTDIPSRGADAERATDIDRSMRRPQVDGPRTADRAGVLSVTQGRRGVPRPYDQSDARGPLPSIAIGRSASHTQRPDVRSGTRSTPGYQRQMIAPGRDLTPGSVRRVSLPAHGELDRPTRFGPTVNGHLVAKGLLHDPVSVFLCGHAPSALAATSSRWIRSEMCSPASRLAPERGAPGRERDLRVRAPLSSLVSSAHDSGPVGQCPAGVARPRAEAPGCTRLRRGQIPAASIRSVAAS